jgi:hypothetical protein
MEKQQMLKLVRGRPAQSGQILVIAAGGMLAVLAVVAMIIDGGNAWAQQRIVQNGSDAAADAGAIVMARRFAFTAAGLTPDVGDAEVLAAINGSASGNGLVAPDAYYTDICGIPLKPDGTAALNPDGTENLAVAARVGTGIPTSGTTTPDCPSLTVGPPAGVMVLAHKDVDTFVARVIGIAQLGVKTRATAVAGYLQGYCSASQGEGCAVLPVTVPVNIVSCDGSNNPINTGDPWLLGPVYKVPLCQNGPGNVGWLDWTPPGGGTSELINSILTPNNPAINLPSWDYVTATGNINSAGVESALRTYDGEVVLIPQFDLTCGPGPNNSPNQAAVSDPLQHNGCLSASVNDLGGNGQNQWYRIPSFAFFQFCISTDPDCSAIGADHGAYVNGNNKPICDTGNGATSCLIGRFVDIIGTGTVGPGVGGGVAGNKAIGVQLIK